MLTKEAFNALLKTLEEPPAHVIFILATTEAHKLPETIVSRTQRFTFKSVGRVEAVKHLRELADKEHMVISDDALELLAEHGGGSFRDAIGLLDQIGNSKKKISRKDVEELIGIAPQKAVESLLKSLLSGVPSDIVSCLNSFTESGIAPAQIAKQLSAELRGRMLQNDQPERLHTYTKLLGELLGVTASQHPGVALEIALFNACSLPADAVTERATPQKPITTTRDSAQSSTSTKKETSKNKPPVVAELQPAQLIEVGDISGWWPQLVQDIKSHNNTMYGVLRLAHPSLEGDNLLLSFAFGLHAKKIADAQINLVLQKAVKILTGRDITIKAVQDKNLKDKIPDLTSHGAYIPEKVIPEKLSTDLGAITSIFGGGEVLES